VKFGVVVFPGSNCDADAFHVVGQVPRLRDAMLWHKDETSKGLTSSSCRRVSYGDYPALRRRSRASLDDEEVAKHAARGGRVLGICNGFQILTERGCCRVRCSGTTRSRSICKSVELTVANASTPSRRR